MTNDNQWMVDLLSGKTRDDPVNNYVNLVNRKGLFDDIGDAFTEQSKQPAVNGKQRMTNALMAGVGAGMKGSQTQLREAKLQELEKDLKEVVGYKVGLQKELGEKYLREGTLLNYGSKRKFDLQRMSSLAKEGKTEEFNDLFGEMYNEFKNLHPDLAGGFGNFVGIVNGAAVFEKNGKLAALNANDALSPIVSSLPEEDQEGMDYLVSLPMRKRIANKNLLQDLAIEEKRAGIAKDYSSANLNNAQTRKADYEMNAPAYNKEVANHNLTYLEEARNKKLKNEALVDTLDLFAKTLEKANKEGAAGSDPLAYATREFQKITGSNENVTLAEMLKQVYFGRAKEVGGSNPSGFELQVALDTIPSINKNFKAAIQILKRDKERAYKELFKFKKMEKALRDSNYQMSPDDENIMKNSELEYQDFLDNYGDNHKKQGSQSVPSIRFTPDE